MTALLIIIMLVTFVGLVWFAKQSNQGNLTSGCGCFLYFFFAVVLVMVLFGEKIFAWIGL